MPSLAYRAFIPLLATSILLVFLQAANAETIRKTKGQSMSTASTTPFNSRCLGRFLLDLPEDAEYEGGRYEYAFTSVEMQRMSYEQFLKEVESLETTLRNTKHKSGTTLLLKKASASEQSRVLTYWPDFNADVLTKTSGFRWIDGMRFLVQATADPDKTDIATTHVDSILSHLNARGSEVPTVPGFCIAHAIVTDEGSSKNESISSRFRLKSKPDIVIDILMKRNPGTPPEPLLSRKPSVFSALGVMGATLGRISTIREGDRKIGGMPGQEWLVQAPNDSGHEANLFTWETPGLRRDALNPQVRIDLKSANDDGGRDPSRASLTKPQMLELWESILTSLRLRPTNGGEGGEIRKSSPQANAESVLPLGELVRTGAICPQTGYWHCPENDVHGSTRLFQAGDAMPPAIIKRDLSFVERLRGSSDQHSTSTVWRLVQYDDPIAASTPASSVGDDTIQPSSDA